MRKSFLGQLPKVPEPTISTNDDGSVTLKLSSPVEVADETIAEIILRDPTSGDMEKADAGKGETSKANRMVSACSDVSHGIVQRMKFRDTIAALEVISHFLGVDLKDLLEEDDLQE